MIVTWPFAIMLLTKNCLQIRQKADGNGVPASHRGATSVRDNRGRHPAITEHSGKALNLDGDFPPRMWNVHAAVTRMNNAVEGWHSPIRTNY